jgi:hypothetical protein
LGVGSEVASTVVADVGGREVKDFEYGIGGGKRSGLPPMPPPKQHWRSQSWILGRGTV